MTGRMVSAEEARGWSECGDGIRADLAHTVVVQAEQIAAVRALAERYRSAEAKMRAAKGSTIGRQWHEQEQARIFAEAAKQIERAIGVNS